MLTSITQNLFHLASMIIEETPPLKMLRKNILLLTWKDSGINNLTAFRFIVSVVFPSLVVRSAPSFSSNQ